MRLLFLLCALVTPAVAQGDPKSAMLAPGPGCEAPPLVPAATLRQVQAPEAAPPYRLAMLACAQGDAGPRKRRLRRT